MRVLRLVGAVAGVAMFIVGAYLVGVGSVHESPEVSEVTGVVARREGVSPAPTTTVVVTSSGSPSDRAVGGPVVEATAPAGNPETEPSPQATTTQPNIAAMPSTTQASAAGNEPVSTTGAQSTTSLPRPNFFLIMLGGDTGTGKLWSASYTRVLPSGAEWLDGDRAGYRCAYMFLANRGQIVGRVTFARIDGADYAVVNDKHMDEGVRYYDGTLAAPGAPKELGQCPFPAEAYQPSLEPEERPTILFWVDGIAVETRNYKPTEVRPGVTFQQISKSDTRVTVVGYVDSLPAIVVYYDVLTANAAITSDF